MAYISKKWLEMPIIEIPDTKYKFLIFYHDIHVGTLLLNRNEYARMLRKLYTTPYYLQAILMDAS